MSDTYTETILFELPLPYFLVDFKNTFNSIVIPKLNTIIQDIQKHQSNSSFLSIMILILLLFMIKSIAANLFASKPVVSQQVTQPQVDEQIRALANQIRNLKNSLKKIIQEAGKSKQGPTENKSNNQIIKPEDVSKLIEYYKEVAENFNNLADFIVDSQQSIFKQLKNVKKLRGTEKTSSHGSREDSLYQPLQPSKQLQQSKSMDADTQQTRTQDRQQPPLEIKTTPRPIIKAPIQPPARKRVAPPPPVTRS